jgi:hypothetical protein
MAEPLEAWPASTVTQNMIRGSYREQIVRTLKEFQVDRGAELTQQGTYIPLRIVSFQSKLSTSQKNALDTFYNVTTIQGTSRVTRKNPKDGVSRTMKFKQAPEYSDYGPGEWIASLTFYQFN